MIPHTFPSQIDTYSRREKMIVYYLSDINGLVRWVDYIPVRTVQNEPSVEQTTESYGFQAIQAIISITGLSAFKDYVPVYEDVAATIPFSTNANGYIPVGLTGGGSATLVLNFISTPTLDSRITFTRADSSTCATYFDSTGTMQTAAANIPRFDYDPTTLIPKGLLIEESRTNSIRNSTMVGAVAGTPGTEPTYWSIDGPENNITQTIVGVGTENGMSYLDIRWQGTPSATSGLDVFMETGNGVACSNGQSWTHSYYLKLVSGTVPGTVQKYCYINNSSQTFSTALGGTTLTLTSDLTRYSLSGTISDAAAAYIRPLIKINYTVDVPVDFTLRIAAPQLELGAFATSYIPTTTAAVTRAADVASMTGTNFSSWYNQTEGTFVVRGDLSAISSSPQYYWQAGATSTDYLAVFKDSTGSYTASRARVGGADQAYLTQTTAQVAGTENRIAFGYKANNFAQSVSAADLQTDTAGTVPTVSALGIGCSTYTTSVQLNGHIARLTYYPKRLSDSVLQALTR